MGSVSAIVSDCIALGIDDLEEVVSGVFETISCRYGYGKAVQVTPPATNAYINVSGCMIWALVQRKKRD